MMDPALLCRIFFSLGTAVDIGGTLIPSFRENIMNYGSRSTTSRAIPKHCQSKITGFLEYVGSFQVPHAWFTHYYVVSVALSVFWALQLYTHGTAFEFLASLSELRPAVMTVNQVFLAWFFMAVQGGRRLYESLIFTKPSRSRMWAGLWIIGIGFYVFMGISVWIEGIRGYRGLYCVW
jgi:3-oxo-5-alpha-steroid 4-dehydrogenase 3